MPRFKEIIIQYVNAFDNTYVDLSGNTQPVQPLDIYLVPNEDLSHDRYVVDNEGVISKQSNGSQANYLRASGTDPDQQIAGHFRTQAATFYAYQNEYPYDSQFKLSPGDIELSSRVIMEDPKNPINRILVREDGIRFTTKNFICDSIPNVQGDTSYTRQLVQKNDGTVGYEDKLLPMTLMPKVDILEYSQDADNWYLEVTVANHHGSIYSSTLQSPAFSVYLGVHYEEGIKAIMFNDWLGSSNYFTVDLYGGSKFQTYVIYAKLRIPKESNTSPYWAPHYNPNINCMISVVYHGLDNLDKQRNQKYPTPRIGIATALLNNIYKS